MNGFLLDTNCISELVRPQPEPNVLNWMEAIDEATLYLSVLTLGEIRKGVAGLAPGRRRAQLETWLDTDLLTRFARRILPIDMAVANRWGLLTAEARRKGRSISSIDALLAATCLHHELTLVSRNVSDFAGTSVGLLNLWEQE